MIENCGPEHADCECEYACLKCSGKVEEEEHLCECRRCDHEGEAEYRCVACDWIGDEYEVGDVADVRKQREERKLADWKSWAVGEVAS